MAEKPKERPTKKRTAVVDGKRPDGDLSLEIKECEDNGYVLYDRFLGKGNYAAVFLGSPKPEQLAKNYKLRLLARGQDRVPNVAIKIVNVETVSRSYICKFLPREVSTMSLNFEHPNVIKLVDFFATEKRIYIVMEYAEHGDLLRYVNRFYSRRSKDPAAQDKNLPRPPGMTEKHAKDIYRDIIQAVRHVHSNDVAHRDLKFENILLADGNVPKLSDFGFAVKRDEEEPLHNTHCGSYAYAAPEVLKRLKYDGKQADVWSLGVILFGLIQGFLPFKASTAKGVLEATKKTIYLRPKVSEAYKQLIRVLLNKIPEQRPTTDEIMKMDWLRDEVIVYDSSDDEECEAAAREMKRRKKIVPPHKPNKLDSPDYIASRIEFILRNLPPLSVDTKARQSKSNSNTKDPNATHKDSNSNTKGESSTVKDSTKDPNSKETKSSLKPLKAVHPASNTKYAVAAGSKQVTAVHGVLAKSRSSHAGATGIKTLPSLKDHDKKVVEVEKRLSREVENDEGDKLKRILSQKSSIRKTLVPLPVEDAKQKSIAKDKPVSFASREPVKSEVSEGKAYSWKNRYGAASAQKMMQRIQAHKDGAAVVRERGNTAVKVNNQPNTSSNKPKVVTSSTASSAKPPSPRRPVLQGSSKQARHKDGSRTEMVKGTTAGTCIESGDTSAPKSAPEGVGKSSSKASPISQGSAVTTTKRASAPESVPSDHEIECAASALVESMLVENEADFLMTATRRAVSQPHLLNQKSYAIITKVPFEGGNKATSSGVGRRPSSARRPKHSPTTVVQRTPSSTKPFPPSSSYRANTRTSSRKPSTPSVVASTVRNTAGEVKPPVKNGTSPLQTNKTSKAAKPEPPKVPHKPPTPNKARTLRAVNTSDNISTAAKNTVRLSTSATKITSITTSIIKPTTPKVPRRPSSGKTFVSPRTSSGTVKRGTSATTTSNSNTKPEFRTTTTTSDSSTANTTTSTARVPAWKNCNYNVRPDFEHVFTMAPRPPPRGKLSSPQDASVIRRRGNITTTDKSIKVVGPPKTPSSL